MYVYSKKVLCISSHDCKLTADPSVISAIKLIREVHRSKYLSV